MDSARVYRVGRDPNNDIVIEHSSVSRRHCELRIADDGVTTLVDIESMNGTSIRENGQWRAIQRVSVEQDDRVLLGEVVTTVAALLQRAPSSVGGLPPAPNPIRRIPLPTAPVQPSSSGLVARVLKNDWARLNRRRDGSRPAANGEPRNPPSLCLPAMSHENENTGEPARPLIHLELPSHSAASEQPWSDPPPEIQLPNEPARRPRQRGQFLFAWATNRPHAARVAAIASIVALSAGVAAAAYLKLGTGRPDSEAAKKVGSRSETASLARPATDQPDTKARKSVKLPEPLNSSGERSTLPPNKLWHRSIEGTPGSAVHAASAARDGGLCLAGQADSAAGGDEAWVMRLDSLGRPRWQRRPGGPHRDAALAVAATQDDGCVAAGYENDGKRLWIFKLDGRGAPAWSKPIPVGHTGRATAISELRDGGFVVAAHAKTAPDKPERAFVLRIDNKGDVQWSRYTGSGESVASDIKPTRDGGYIVTGLGRNSGKEPMALWVAKVDAQGHTMWERRLAAAGTPLAPRVQIAPDGDYVIAVSMSGNRAGAVPDSLRLVRLSSRGETIWDQKHAGEPRRLAGMVVGPGGIVLAGDNGDRPSKQELWLAHFDAQGRRVQESRLGGVPSDRAASLTELKDGRLLIAGTTEFDASRRGAGLVYVGRDRQLVR